MRGRGSHHEVHTNDSLECLVVAKVFSQAFVSVVGRNHSDDILGARMLWKPKEARILKNFIDQPV
jgi:hypothetical protein